MKLQNVQFKNGKLLELLGTFTRCSQFWDTSLICSDGILKQNRLISFLIMPILCDEDLNLMDMVDFELEQNIDELTIILPDTTQSEVIQLIHNTLKVQKLNLCETACSNSDVGKYESKRVRKSSKNNRKHFIEYVCGLCNQTFKTHSLLQQHNECVHKSDEITTMVEENEVSNVTDFQTRKLSSLSTETEKFLCGDCDYTTAYKQHLKQHVNFVHKGIGQLCDHCGFKARDKGQLKNHVLATHQGVRFKCKFCDFKAKSKGNLKQHVESLHQGIRHRCELCNYSTPYLMNLKNHIKVAHEGFRYECDICDYKATSNGRLKTHKEVKHEGIRYSCHMCEYKGTVKASLKRHIEAVHKGVKYPCSHCEYKATSRQHLKIHIESMHEMIRYPCDQCAFQATTRGHLKTHIKSHHLN